MKEPITVPTVGYIYSEGRIEEYKITRYGVLPECIGATMDCVDPEGWVYQTTANWLHDTPQEALMGERDNLLDFLRDLAGSMDELAREQREALSELDSVLKLMAADEIEVRRA